MIDPGEATQTRARRRQVYRVGCRRDGHGVGKAFGFVSRVSPPWICKKQALQAIAKKFDSIFSVGVPAVALPGKFVFCRVIFVTCHQRSIVPDGRTPSTAIAVP